MYYSNTKNAPNLEQTFREKIGKHKFRYQNIKSSVIENIPPLLPNLYYLPLLIHSFIHPQIIYTHTHLNK